MADSVFGRVWNYVADNLSNRRWALELKQMEQTLNEGRAKLKKDSKALSDRRNALKAMALKIKEAEANLRCAQVTFELDRQEMIKETIAQAKESAKSECEVISQGATQELQAINTEIGQKQAELLALEKRLRNLREVLAGVTETLDVGLRGDTQESESTLGKSIYLVANNVSPEETTTLVANRENNTVKREWAASLFSTEEPTVSSSALITTAACLRVS